MKAFHCDSCHNLIFFENIECVKCHHSLGYLPDAGDLSALEPEKNNSWRALSPTANNRRYRLCLNGQQHQVCNWMIPVAEGDSFCQACRLNTVIPDLKMAGHQVLWHKVELAKRRIIFRLLQLRLPFNAMPEHNRPGLQFQFLADPSGGPSVISGHDAGLITLNIAEADDLERERRRVGLHEPFRTLLGHMRHEIAHYYWDRLVANSRWSAPFRDVFGDERLDYGKALKAHYQMGPPADWQSSFISAYASTHPWEDWAESWAHYFHILDMTETAASFGLSLRPFHPSAQTMSTEPAQAHDLLNFDTLMSHWFPLTYALNTLNRDMGLTDLYPFALCEPVIQKLRFVHGIVQQSRT